MPITATKLTDSSIQVVKQDDAPAPVTQTYDYDFLLSQKAAIIKQANDFLAQRQKELDDIQALLDQADALGVKQAVMPQPLGTEVATPGDIAK